MLTLMVQFKFVVFFFRVVWLKLAVPSAKNPEFFTDGQIMPFENGIVKHPTPMVNWNDFQNCTRIMFREIVGAFSYGCQYLHKISIVTHNFIIKRVFFGIAKCQIKPALPHWLEQYDLFNNSFWASTFKKKALPVLGGYDVISFPQHAQSFFALSNESSPTGFSPIILTQ